MTTNVLMIDEDKFIAEMNERVKKYKALADCDSPNKVIYNGAIAVAISEIGHAIQAAAKVEKWD